MNKTFTNYIQPKSAFDRIWVLDRLGIETLMKFIMGDSSIWTGLKNLFSNPSDCVSKITYYPFSLTPFYELREDGETLGWYFGISLYNDPVVWEGRVCYGGNHFQLAPPKNVLISRIVIGETNMRNFIYYPPYSSYEIYIPYVGYKEIDINKYRHTILSTDTEINREIYHTGDTIFDIRVYCNLDVANGVALFSICDYNNTIIEKYGCSIGIDIPIGATNAYEVRRNVLEQTINTVTEGLNLASSSYVDFTKSELLPTGAYDNRVAVGKLAGGLTNWVGNSISGFINAGVKRYSRGGIASPQLEAIMPYRCFIIRTSTEFLTGFELNTFRKYYGQLSGKTKDVDDLNGFNTITGVNIPLSNITAEEANDIKKLLKEGCIFGE